MIGKPENKEMTANFKITGTVAQLEELERILQRLEILFAVEDRRFT